MTSPEVPLWWFAGAAVLAAAALGIRCALLANRQKVSVGIALALVASLGLAFLFGMVKHNSSQQVLVLYIDVMVSILVALIGQGDYVRGEIERYAAGNDQPANPAVVRRMTLTIFGVGIVLVVGEQILGLL
ncbi:hypothetical protein ABH931_007418 [Streptacidiphilus sp. MAP12-33]|uniref:hypothetical protein n=1 Tax=Streptacidiphilus sp. MAP12-33 TaxID=3156266 RepID=UPI00351307F2